MLLHQFSLKFITIQDLSVINKNLFMNVLFRSIVEKKLTSLFTDFCFGYLSLRSSASIIVSLSFNIIIFWK